MSYSEIIPSFLKAIRANTTAIVIVVLVLLLLAAIGLVSKLYYDQNQSHLITNESIRTNCSERIKILNDEYAKYQMKSANEYADLAKKCRFQFDSLEDVYYKKFKLLNRKINNLDTRLEKIDI